MEFKELVKARRSCRAFDGAAVTEEQLAFILEAGQSAPSPLNLQPFEFIVITDKNIRAQIKSIAEEAKQTVIDKGGPGWAAKYEMNFIEEAPVLIAIIVDSSKGGLGSFFGQPYGAMQAASACIQNMMLAASDRGLESLWFTFFAPEKLKEALDIPQNLEIAGVLPIGKPKEPIKAPPRKEPQVHRQRYLERNQ
jgi:5,6-dimethylbenzimidazole synthase